MAFESKADELYFGGAAGGGKTALGVGLSITFHKRTLILRRQAVQVVEIVDQIKRYLGAKGWRGLGHGGTMHLPNGGTVEIAGCDHEDDKEKFQGRPHDLIYFDEAVHFSRSQFRFISAWNRHEDPKQRCRIVLGSNPPTSPEGRWIIEEFAPWLDSEYPNSAKPGELRWYTVLNDKLTWVENGDPFTYKGERIQPRSRTFVPSRLSDNPILSATNYAAALQALPEPLRSQMLYGDMNAGLEDDPWQVIPTDWVRKAMQRWTPNPPKGLPMTCLGVDVARGGKDKTVLAPRHGPWYAPLKKYEGKKTPDGPAVELLVLNTRFDHAEVNIDVIGIGASAYDFLKQHKHFQTNPINNSEHKIIANMRDKSGKLKFVNVRAASYWKFRESLDPDGEERIMLPPDNELLADLCAPQYKLLAGGIQIEPKEDIIDRIGRSPDCGDAVVLASFSPWKKPMRIHVFSGKSTKTQGLKIVVCNREELANLTIEDHKTLLVSIADPISDDEPREELPQPLHGLVKMVDFLQLRFADLDPAEWQEKVKNSEVRWEDPIIPYGRRIDELIINPQEGKKLWSFLTKKGRDAGEVWVIHDEDDRRALSVAYAVCDIIHLPRSSTIHKVGDEEWKADAKDTPPNKHVFETVKSSRGMVL